MSMKHARGFGFSLSSAWMVGLLLRLWNLPAQVVGDDEIHTVRAVLARPVGELLSSYGRLDYSLPMAGLYRALVDLGVGLSETVLRLLPLLAGLALLVVLPLGVQAWLGRRAACWLAWLLAVSAPLVYYSRVVRPYSWSVLLGLVAVGAFARWWPRGEVRHLLVYGAAGGLGVWFLPVVAPFVGAPLLWAATDTLRLRDAATLRRFLLAAVSLAGAVAALFAPAAPDLLEVVSRKAGRTPPGLLVWLGALQLNAGTRSALLAAALGALAAAGFVRHLRRDRKAALYWALPVAVQALAMQVAAPLGSGQPFILQRYLLPTLPVILAWAAYTLAVPLRRPIPAAVASLAAGGSIAALLATGPFVESAFRSSSFMHHKDYLELYAAPGHLPPEAIPRSYRTLLPVLPPGPVLEFPWVPVWHFNDAYRLYQEVHGREVVVATTAPRLQDPRLVFRNMVPGTPEGFLASRARFLLLHRDYGAEEARVVEPEWPAASLRRRLARALRGAAGTRSDELRRLWGPPDWEDGEVEVWDLDRVRRSLPRS